MGTSKNSKKPLLQREREFLDVPYSLLHKEQRFKLNVASDFYTFG
jgi:hypothetical protein